MRDPATAAETAPSGQDQLHLDAQPPVPLAHDGLSAEQLEVVFQHSFDTIMVLERDGTVRYTNPSVLGMRGTADEFTFGPEGLDQIHPDDVADVLDAFAECARSPGLSPRLQLRLRHPDGHWVTMQAVGNNLLDDPRIQGIVVSVRDITIQRETEPALRASEGRLRDQAHILEMIATSEPLGDILAEICRSVEAYSDGTRCTIWLVDEDAWVLRPGAAPSFPDSFLRALDGLPVADGAAACGTAAFRAETVV